MSKRKSSNIYRQNAGEDEVLLLARNEYDEQGNIVKEIRYLEDGETEAAIINRTFDEKNRLLSEVLTVDGAEHKRAEKKWTDNGKLLEEKVMVNGVTLESHIKYQWKEDFSEAILTFLDFEGNVYDNEFHAYDEQGNLIKEQFLDEDGGVVEGYEYAYDEHGSLIKKVTKQGGFEVESTVRNSYNEGGQLTEAMMVDDEQELEEIQQFQYYKDGTKKQEVSVDAKGAKDVSIFDEKGRVKKLNKYDETEFLYFEISSFYGDEHEYLVERTVREDRKFYKLVFEYEFFD